LSWVARAEARGKLWIKGSCLHNFWSHIPS